MSQSKRNQIRYKYMCSFFLYSFSASSYSDSSRNSTTTIPRDSTGGTLPRTSNFLSLCCVVVFFCSLYSSFFSQWCPTHRAHVYTVMCIWEYPGRSVCRKYSDPSSAFFSTCARRT